MGLLVSITLLLLADLRILWKCLICNTFCRDHFVYALSLIGWAHAQNNRCFWAPMPLTVPLHSPNCLAFWLKRGSIHCWEFSRIEHCNGCYFADKMFQHIFVKENIGILIEISLKFVLNHLIVLFPNPFSLSSEQPNNAFFFFFFFLFSNKINNTYMQIVSTHIQILSMTWYNNIQMTT